MSGIDISQGKLAELLGGRAESEGSTISCRGTAFDSRDISGGELFVALSGEETHGHSFVPSAFERGAALALVEDVNAIPQEVPRERLIEVPDTLESYWKLASWWREKNALPVAAVTGSVGKTTVKEMMGAILRQHSSGKTSEKSHNNHVGVPYSICRVGMEDNWSVLELGMNHPGEIRELTGLASPDVAVVTKIGLAHKAAFNSLNEIAQAKLEIREGITEGGLLIINGDDEILCQELSKLESGSHKTLRFGASGDYQAILEDVKAEGIDGISFKLTLLGEQPFDIIMKVPGAHSAYNAAAAALAAKSLLPELSVEHIRQGLSSFRMPHLRLEIVYLGLSEEAPRLVNDAYNANPSSMRALLELAKGEVERGSRVGLVLGDMLELGEESHKYHEEIGELVAKIEPEFLYAIGEFAESYRKPLRESNVTHAAFTSAQDAFKEVEAQSFDILFLKGSRRVGLEKLADMLIEASMPVGDDV